MVVTGDLTQVDLPRARIWTYRSRRILKKVPGLYFHEFDHDDVVNHPLVSAIFSLSASCGKSLICTWKRIEAIQGERFAKSEAQKELIRDEKLEDSSTTEKIIWMSWGKQFFLSLAFAITLIFICFVGRIHQA